VAALSATAGCVWSGDNDDDTAGGDADDDDDDDGVPTPDEPDQPTDEESSDFADEFEHTVNIVDAGADPTGHKPIDEVLRSHAADDTLIEFPPGRYRVEAEFISDVSRFGMRGEDATIVPADGNDELLFGLGDELPPRNFSWRG